VVFLNSIWLRLHTLQVFVNVDVRTSLMLMQGTQLGIGIMHQRSVLATMETNLT